MSIEQNVLTLRDKLLAQGYTASSPFTGED